MVKGASETLGQSGKTRRNMEKARLFRDLARILTAFAAAAFLAVLSVVSAQLMVPDKAALERQAVLLAMGASLADICGTGEEGHDHACPFCHELPEAPRVSGPKDGTPLAWVLERQTGRDLVVGPQDIYTDASPRGPPKGA